ncbi:MAG: putative Ig domain-containing protein, partial [Archangium sp.]|nr:putative Ig domain-containing protein [Archangium sp.]
NPTSAVRQQAVSGPNGAGTAIEWRDWNRAFGAYTLNFQIRLWENGVIEFFYGTMIGSGATITASVGIESPNGASATMPLTIPSRCATGSQCNLCSFEASASTCTGSPVTPYSYIRFGPPAGTDVQGNRVRVTGIVQDGGVLQVSTELELRNFGTLASGDFGYRMYLSQDTLIDSSDYELQPTPNAVTSLGANELRVVSTTSTSARPDAGSFYVVAVLDSEAAVTETNEANNTVASTVPFSAGVDLIAERIIAPALAGPGDSVSIPIEFTNQGFDNAGNVPVRIWASVDTIVDGTDRLLHTTTMPIVGGQNVSQSITFVMPSNLRGDDYFLMLQLDDTPGVIPESNKTNNRVFSQTKMTVRQADLVMDAVTVRRSVQPFDQASVAFFGEPIRIDALVRNQGGATAPTVLLQFLISENETLNAFTDPTVGTVTNLSLAPGETRLVSLTANVPSLSTTGQPLGAQPYYFFAAAVAPGLAETNGNNNFTKSVPTLIRGPAPNLVPVAVQGPQRAGVGELIPVTRTLANIGNRAATGVTYRYYLSANEVVTTSDVLLQIQTPTGLVNQKSVDLTIDQQDHASELVRIPAGLLAADYFLGVLVDADGSIAETDENDNGFASQPLAVVARSLSVATPFLPDAVIGQPYTVSLAAYGAGAMPAWSVRGAGLPPGLQLDAQGRLTGTPTSPGAYGFTLVLTAGADSVEATRSIRVVNSTAGLEVSTELLPAPVRLLSYDGQLGVAGGRAPYVWAVLSGELPLGLELSASGRVTGTPRGALGTSTTFVLGVRDAIGNASARTFTLTVVDATPFQISTPPLLDGVVNAEYLTLLTAKNGGGAPVSTPLRWALVEGQLPGGIQLENSTAEVVGLSGTPTQAGLFPFRIEVTDAQGRVAAVNMVILVSGEAVQISGPVPDVLTPGMTVSALMLATPGQQNVSWFVREGRLPPGLSLSPEGLLAGTVENADSALGSYTFTVAVGPARTELRGLRTYRIDVASTLPVPRGGCSAVGIEPLAVLVLLWLRRRTA